jgi:hypothetical protein
MANANIGSLNVKLSASAQQFRSEMMGAADTTRRFTKDVKQANAAAASVAKFQIGGGLSGSALSAHTSALAAGVRSQQQAASSIREMVSGWQRVRGISTLVIGTMAGIVVSAVSIRRELDGASKAANLLNDLGKDYADNAEKITARTQELQRAMGRVAADDGLGSAFGMLGRELTDDVTSATVGIRFFERAQKEELGRLKTGLGVQEKMVAAEKKKADAKARAERMTKAREETDESQLESLDDRQKEEAQWARRYWDRYLDYFNETDAEIRKIRERGLQYELQAHRRLLAERAKEDQKEADKLRKETEEAQTSLKDDVARARSGLIESSLKGQTDPGIRLIIKRKALEVQAEHDIAALRERLDKEKNAEARAMLTDLIRLRKDELDQDIENSLTEEAENFLQRRRAAVSSRERLQLFESGSAEAIAARIDAANQTDNNLEEKTLRTIEDIKESLRDLVAGWHSTGQAAVVIGWP